MVMELALVVVAAFCGIQAVRAVHLLHAALWLAGVSVTAALLLYLVGAYVMAVIELSVSVGLVTILLVFAISMVGADSPDRPVAHRINVPLVTAMLLLVIGLTIPLSGSRGAPASDSFSVVFWQQRQADVFAQIALIFAGVLGVLGLLAETGIKRKPRKPVRVRQLPEPDRESRAFENETELEKV